MKKLVFPWDKKEILKLRAGDEVLLTGTIYTARDQAHKYLVKIFTQKRKLLDWDIAGKIIYYCGPTATPKGKIIGSCGPTTSSRMDEFVEPLLAKGLLGMIGKGRRADKVVTLIKKYKAIYFLAPAGCGALLAKRVVSQRLLLFKELGPEAIYELEVKSFPLIVGIDAWGRNIYFR